LASGLFSADDFRKAVATASAVLDENRSKVDALNVFPVPDGDTGTNMSLTMKSAAAEVGKCGSNRLGDLAQAASMGSLMGARGNSGVILSQLFRGLAKALEGKEAAGPIELAWAFQEGVNTAYKAVMKPVEGTILTVAREAARAAVVAARENADILGVLRAALESAEKTLAQTPDMLPVLKQSGVVDAGGKGLVYILTGVIESILGGRMDVRTVQKKPVEFLISEEMGDIVYPYDTQFLIKGKGLAAAQIRARLQEMGDSLLVVGSEDLVRVHIHTDNPGRVLDYCVRLGTLTGIVIENMKEQHEALKSVANGDANGEHDEAVGAPILPQDNGDYAVEKEVGVAAVALGAGLEEVLKSLGVDEIVSGGQTMNPSTEDVLNAIQRVRARRVIFLPNNGNIILAAKQAKRLANRKVYVVPTKTIPQGIAALLAFRPDANMETNLKRMAKAVRRVKTGEITYAVRSTSLNGMTIQPGDVLGMWDGDIAIKGSNPEEVLFELAEKMLGPDDEILTVFYGDLVPQEKGESLAAELARRFPQVDVEVRFGGQPLYYYIMSVE